MLRENRLHPSSFILPIFVTHGSKTSEPIDALPGHSRLSVDLAADLAAEAEALGVGGVLLFGIPADKDETGSEASDPEGVVQLTIQAIRARTKSLTIITDVCLCGYTSHGHCGVIKEGDVLNDVTLEMLADVAVSHARAGADVVAPSDMMDGRVAAIRSALDREGFGEVSIMSYAVKFASSFYGPFREAAGSAPSFGDRRSYQMDPANGNEALREAALDIEEGADYLMVKPALSYLDLVWRIKNEYRLPLAVYHVSGEYSMVKAAAERGWADERGVFLEELTSMKRAGADLIITYTALDAARWLAEEYSEAMPAALQRKSS